MLLAALFAAAIAAGGLALTAVACAVLGLAYLLQGTWLTALALGTGYVLAGSAVMLLAGLAKRCTMRHRARLGTAVITRRDRLTPRRSTGGNTGGSGRRRAPRRLNAPGHR
ncbi:hypothetical protein [Actinomadura sp. 9N215]|uniref:hypothetical protein n=1 Tax=Actinomadura sp. 9N215 TaxID=3375150 RepID=UPI0037A6EA95